MHSIFVEESMYPLLRVFPHILNDKLYLSSITKGSVLVQI